MIDKICMKVLFPVKFLVTAVVHYLFALFLSPVSNCPIIQDGCKL